MTQIISHVWKVEQLIQFGFLFGITQQKWYLELYDTIYKYILLNIDLIWTIYFVFTLSTLRGIGSKNQTKKE